MTVDGDFDKLKAWEGLFGSGDALMPQVSRAMAEEALSLIADGFRGEQDPYGKKWAAKQRSDGRKVLHGKTNNLRMGWHVAEADAGGLLVAPGKNAPYAVAHQAPGRRGKKGRGAFKRPPRKMVPDKRGIPKAWSVALEETADDVLKLHFGAGGGSKGILGSQGMGIVAARIAAMKRRFNIKAMIRKAARFGDDDK